jgi:hypothetical protein
MLFEKLLFFTEQGNANPIYSDIDNSELGGVTNTFVETAPDSLYGEIYDREFPLSTPRRYYPAIDTFFSINCLRTRYCTTKAEL